MDLFAGTVVVLLFLGLLAAAYFCLTWTPRAMRYRGTGGWAMLDTAGWVWAGLLLLVITLARLATHGEIRPPADGMDAAVRLGSLLFVDFVIWVRAVRWFYFRREAKNGRVKNCSLICGRGG